MQLKVPYWGEAKFTARTTPVVQARNDRKIPAFQDFLVVRGQPSPWLSNTHHLWSTSVPVIGLRVDILTWEKQKGDNFETKTSTKESQNVQHQSNSQELQERTSCKVGSSIAHRIAFAIFLCSLDDSLRQLDSFSKCSERDQLVFVFKGFRNSGRSCVTYPACHHDHNRPHRRFIRWRSL